MKLIITLILICSFIYSRDFHRFISSSPNRLNPYLATDSASGEISSWIYRGLVKFDKDGNIIPDMAQSWRFEDNKTLIFYLKRGILWHDGVEFSAKDVAFTYKWLNQDSVITPYKSDFKYVLSVEALDKYIVKVTYSQAYFKALSIWMGGIIPKHLWEREKNPMQSPLNKKAIGTGPYMMKEPFRVNERITLYANRDFYEHSPRIKKQIFHYIPDPSTQFMMLKSGKLDIGSLTPNQLAMQIDDEFKKRYAIYEKPSQGYTYIGFNLKKKPFNNPKVREALSLAIDRQEIIDLLFFSHGKACYGPFMPGSDVYPTDYKPPKYNPQLAKKLFKEAGYDNKHPLRFTLTTNTGNETRVYAAQIIQQQLARVGVEMKIRSMEWQAFLNTVVFPRNFDAVLLGWSLSLIPDAYPLWHSESDKKGGFNFVGYHNKEVDRLIKESEKIVDRKEFAKYYRKIFKIIANDNPYIFLYIPNSITAVNRDIEGIEPSIIGIEHNFIDWRFKD